MNFLMGNQYCDIRKNGEIDEYEKKYFWQEREVFNHILPIIERRLSKLQKVRPKMNVFPASNNDGDIKTAKISKKIINSIYNKTDMSNIIMEATKWSEICGSGFYKVIWNTNLGNVVAKLESGVPLKSGDVEITAVSSFEIFPESSSSSDIQNSRSIIHARAYHIEEIKNQWGVEIEGEDINIFTLDKSHSSVLGMGSSTKVLKSVRKDYAIVVEKYEAPSVKYPNGRLIIIAKNKLLFVGELPYTNCNDNTRTFPFIKQDAFSQAGCFWGTSLVERLIPLQRSYNAVKNRKHEFLNRISMGILAVEDGSVDIENLEEDGLCPGKVLVYRQGSTSPKYMENDKMPYDFTAEEKSILDEFVSISGITDLSSENYSTRNLSGTALELIIEQDENKTNITSDNTKSAIKTIGKHILRLYKQFVKIPKLTKIVGDNGEMEMFYFTSSDISSDDIVFETKNEMTDSYTQNKKMIFDLLNNGLLNDENGKLTNRMKVKVLELLGFGIWENAQDLNELHTNKASKENFLFLENQDPKILEIDDHQIHINEHISFMLGNEFEKQNQKNPNLEIKILQHIKNHKTKINNNIYEICN
ncbi:MAG: hypothetical protein PHQ62_02900 [Clostridia bacterium]|nr:hypothetical protein [Clostridia bacterium]